MGAEARFIGRGWAFPPRFTSGGADVEMVSGPEDIHQSLQILFSTEPGERVMQESFGCAMDSVLFEELDQGLINSLTSLVSDAILHHETRIVLDRLDVAERPPGSGMLLISIDYTVRGTNSRYNMVYPFCLKEAAASGI